VTINVATVILLLLLTSSKFVRNIIIIMVVYLAVPINVKPEDEIEPFSLR